MTSKKFKRKPEPFELRRVEKTRSYSHGWTTPNTWRLEVSFDLGFAPEEHEIDALEIHKRSGRTFIESRIGDDVKRVEISNNLSTTLYCEAFEHLDGSRTPELDAYIDACEFIQQRKINRNQFQPMLFRVVTLRFPTLLTIKKLSDTHYWGAIPSKARLALRTATSKFEAIKALCGSDHQKLLSAIL